jgi:peptidyl-prolyl cis-trans isomerase C
MIFEPQMNTDGHGSPPRPSAHRAGRTGRIHGWGGALSVFICVHLWFFFAASSAFAADAVAIVNGTPITDGMVTDVVKSLIATRRPPPSSEEIAQLTDAALESLIDLELLYQAAQREQIRVTDQEVQAEIARSKARMGGERAFATALQQSGLTPAQLAAETRKTLMVDRLFEQRTGADKPVAPETARRFYDEHRQEFQHGDQARLRELVVRVAPTASPADRAKARQLADDLQRQVRGGAPVETFAKTYAVDSEAAAHGGDRGFVDREALPPPLAQAAFTLPIGQVSDVLETSDGYCIIVVAERRPAGTLSFDDARPMVEETLRESDRRQRQQAYVAELRQGAKIERPTPGAQ